MNIAAYIILVLHSLVGNVADMSPRVVATPTMSSKNWPTWNVTDAVTGFMAGSRVGLDNLPCIFYLDIYMVIFSRLHNSEDVSVAPTAPERVVPICPKYTWVHVWCTPLLRCCLWGPCTALADCCMGRETTLEELTTCFVLTYARDHLKFLVCKLISFVLNILKSLTS